MHFVLLYNPMEQLTIFREIILDELKRRSWSRKQLAQLISMDPTLITSMLRGERRFNEDQVISIADVLDMEPYQLFTKDKLMPESKAQDLVRKAREFQESFQLVEELEPVACGNLSNISNQSIIGYKAFDKHYLKGMFKPFLTRASGDSMFPTMADGDMILFNRDPDKLKAPDPNKIYLVNLTPGEEEPGLTIKRVEFSAESWELTTIPDNRQYPIERHKMSERKSVLDYVLGTATWIGKEMES